MKEKTMATVSPIPPTGFEGFLMELPWILLEWSKQEWASDQGCRIHGQKGDFLGKMLFLGKALLGITRKRPNAYGGAFGVGYFYADS